MKKNLFIFLVLFLAVSAQIQAKTIHWLTFIDTTDENVGKIDLNTRKILYSRWIEPTNAVLKENGYSVNTLDIYGHQTSPEKCKTIVENLNCSSEDIVIFYYVGHGTENTNTSKYPLMLMGQLNIHKFIPLSWVHNTLKSKGARLTVTIGMCCNARQGVPGRNSPSFSPNYGATYVDDEMAAAIRSMFLKYQGDIIISSASPNESSYACGTPIGDTDYFTFSLINQFNTVLPNKSNPNWESMLKEIREDVKQAVKVQCGKSQTAMWTPNLSTIGTPRKTEQAKPESAPNTNKDMTDNKTILNNILAYISSTNVAETKRISSMERFKNIFTRNLEVKIMSQDGSVVVDKEQISTFLGRISTSRLLLNVSVVDFDINANGKVCYLRVREVYKK